MNIQELRNRASEIIRDLKDHGHYPKENNLIDYKLNLNISPSKNDVENFLINLARDIVAFSNHDGGIILIGIKEDKTTGLHTDVGLDDVNFSLLQKLDLNDITQQFEKMVKVGISIDLQPFQIASRKFYTLLIEKQSQVIIPINDFLEYKLKMGEIVYRASGKNEKANSSTSDFNRFLHVKAGEKNKEFLQMWSVLFPEMVEINPKEVLIINPNNGLVYGYNTKDKTLASSEVEIESHGENVFNIILNAISAGEIGRITDNEGKPLYKIVGEISNTLIKDSISLTTLTDEIGKRSNYTFSFHLKAAIFHLGWVKDLKFDVINPEPEIINPDSRKYIWIEETDKIKKSTKIVFSTDAIDKLLEITENESNHITVFGRKLSVKKAKKLKDNITSNAGA